MGFHSVGFSPMLASPNCHDQMRPQDLDLMLEQMTACGGEFECRLVAESGTRSRTWSPRCGKSTSVHTVPTPAVPVRVSRCFRIRWAIRLSPVVGDEAARMETLVRVFASAASRPAGSPPATSTVRSRAGHAGALPVRSVSSRGHRPASTVRVHPGWLHYCLQAYVRLLTACPDYFEG